MELVRETLLAEAPGGLRSEFVVSLFDDIMVLSDWLSSREPDAAMGMAAMTVALAHASVWGERRASALNLGCGAGTVALVLASEAERVVATDIVPRAVELTRINAVLNDIAVDARVGNLFEPVAGERFDLIASQPPFISRPEGEEAASFLHGGARGDELPLAVLRGLAAHLTPGGVGVLAIEWPASRGDAPIIEAVRKALLAPERDVLLLKAPAVSALEQATLLAAGEWPELGEPFARAVEARLSHYDANGITAFVPTLLVVGPSAGSGAAGDTVTIQVGPLGGLGLLGPEVRRVLDAMRLRRSEQLETTRLRAPKGITLVESQAGVGSEVPSKIQAFLPAGSLFPPLGLTPVELAALTAVHESDTVTRALERLANDYEIDPREVDALGIVKRLVAAGLLVDKE